MSIISLLKVGTRNLFDDSVTSPKIKNMEVDTQDVNIDAITSAKIWKTIGSSGQVVIALSSRYTPVSSLSNFTQTTGGYIRVEFYISSIWRGQQPTTGLFLCDGVNVSFYNTDSGSSRTLYYQIMA